MMILERDFEHLKRVLTAVWAGLPEGELRQSFADLTMGELLSFDPAGPEWARYVEALSPDARAHVLSQFDS